MLPSIGHSFRSRLSGGNNSNDPVAGRVSGVVIDEGGHTVCLLSVT